MNDKKRKELEIKVLHQMITTGVATAEEFEQLIKLEGLTMFNIALIGEYYKDDLTQEDKQQAEKFFR